MGVLEVRDLGEVKDAFEDVRSRSRADGGNSVILSVLKQSDANDVEVSDGVQQIMPQLEDLLPQGATIFAVDDTADFVRGALANVRSNMIMGVFLTALALYLFLGSLRGTAIVAVVMPASLIVTFACMLAAGFTMNILTLTALALSMGIVVTNSILVLENTHRFLEQGLMPVDAAVKGTGDIAVPVLASTATNLVVFIPIAFMGEIIGRLFREFGLTIVYVTTVSLFVSFTLTPMMCGAMLKGTSEEERPRGSIRRAGLWVFHLPYRVWTAAFEWVSRRYMELLGWCLRWRWTTLLGMSAVVVACVLVLGVVGAEFFPPSDEGTLRVTVEAPVGSSLEFTDGRVREVEKIIEDGLPKGYLRHCYSRVGQVAGFLGASSQGTNLAEIGVVVIDKAQRKESVDDLLNALRPALAGVRSAKLSAAASGQHGGGSAAISIEVTGNDMEDLKRVTAQIAQLASTVPGATDVDQSYRTGQPEIQFIPDQQKCGRQGLTVRDVALALRTFVEGAKVSQFRDRGEDYDIRLRLAEENRDSAEDVEGMFIVSPRTGQMIRIGELATPRHGAGPNVIMRKNKQRLITVSVGLTGTRSLQEVERDMEQRIAGEVDLPHGVNISFGGQVEMMKKNFGELYKAMGTATLLTFLCTAGLIESFSLAVIILLAVPLCITGVALSLLIGNVTLNLFSLMAMIMVVGMVVNNAIIVLDYAGRPEHAHMPAAARVKDACAVRLRVMTMASLTTVVAMIPLAMGIGFAGEIFRPLAVVQIGGMIAATTICLVVIPVVYAIVEDFRAWWRRRRGHAP
jgi:HAE1 family hydrophobic/amphiphilic exporter-1